MTENPLDPNYLTGLDVGGERIKEIAHEFEAIRAEIEKLRLTPQD